jgi:hypothetical protein
MRFAIPRTLGSPGATITTTAAAPVHILSRNEDNAKCRRDHSVKRSHRTVRTLGGDAHSCKNSRACGTGRTSGTADPQAPAGHRRCKARARLEDPAVHARAVPRGARRVVLRNARLPLSVGQGRGHGPRQSRDGPPKHDGRDDQCGHRGQSADHMNVARGQAALDAEAQCVSNAVFRSDAISCAVRPSICQRSSMKATSPFLSRAMLGELGA